MDLCLARGVARGVPCGQIQRAIQEKARDLAEARRGAETEAARASAVANGAAMVFAPVQNFEWNQRDR
jgi:hypothetical protein